jgi:hypothetical protein
MEPNEKQYERIARWLDGADLRIDRSERQTAEEFRRLERDFASLLEVATPPEAISSAGSRIAAGLSASKTTSRRIRYGAFMAAALAVAAAIILTVASLWTPVSGNGSGEVPNEVLFGSLTEQSVHQAEISTLAQRVGDFEQQMLTLAADETDNAATTVEEEESYIDELFEEALSS